MPSLGICNRTVCSQTASWWNTSTRAYYCGDCARQINAAARRFDGVARLCILNGGPEQDNEEPA